MPLHRAMLEEQAALLDRCGAEPVPQEVIERYRRELDEDRVRYEAEERIRIARTHQLANTTVVV